MPKKPPEETPLYVRLPAHASETLTRAAEELGVHKKALVADLVTRYLDPKRPGAGRHELADPRRTLTVGGGTGATLGAYSFQAYDPPEVMNAAQAAHFLQLDEATILELAEAGQLPGRKLGAAWRFSRAALVAWLAKPEQP
ncbi:MAG: helix-turn-helix domain-containing protein [Kofleriaceae bacterium]